MPEPLEGAARRKFGFTCFRVRRNLRIMALGNEETLWVLVLLGCCGVVIYLVVHWVMEARPTANPWGTEIEEAVNDEQAVPLCHHCLTPQEHSGWFCPVCGATVGPYSNYMPYIYAFSYGEVLRAGITERIRRSAVIIIGLILLPLALVAIAAPIYWFFLFQHLGRGDDRPTETPPIAT